MADTLPLPSATCGPACTEQHTYLHGCVLCCAELHGGIGEPTWTVPCPRCEAPVDRPCRRRDSTVAAISCGPRWAEYDRKTAARRPELQPASIVDNSMFPFAEPAPLTSPTTPPEPVISAITFKRLTELIDKMPLLPPAVPRHPNEERRERYADLIRTRIKTLTFPPPYPGAAPTFGATEYDLADVVLHAQDAENSELTQLRAERDRLQRGIDAVRAFNEVVADGSCRVQAAIQARDTLHHLDRALASPTPDQGTP